jgi:GABA(A) receptor-associated protein
MPADAGDLEARKASAAAIRAKHPDRIPVIVHKREGDASLPDIDKRKFLVPSDLTIGQFMYVIRKRIKLAPEQAIFLFVASGTPSGKPSGILPSSVATLKAVYDQHCAEDGFLYMTYSGENVFGAYGAPCSGGDGDGAMPANAGDLEAQSSAAIRAKHPDRIPVIVRKCEGDASLPDMDKRKFLVPSDLTIGQFTYVIRKRIKLGDEQDIFLFVASGTLPPSVATLKAVDDQHCAEDGFLYMTYSGENGGDV